MSACLYLHIDPHSFSHVKMNSISFKSYPRIHIIVADCLPTLRPLTLCMKKYRKRQTRIQTQAPKEMHKQTHESTEKRGSDLIFQSHDFKLPLFCL